MNYDHYNQIKQSIIDNITANGKGKITGQVLQDILLNMLELQKTSESTYIYEQDIPEEGDILAVEDSLVEAIEYGKILFFRVSNTAVPATYRYDDRQDIFYITLTLPSDIQVTDPDVCWPNIDVRNTILVMRLYYQDDVRAFVMESAKYLSPTTYEQQ